MLQRRLIMLFDTHVHLNAEQFEDDLDRSH